MKSPLIIALDFPSKQEVISFLEKFAGEKLFVKVGMELFYREGAAMIAALKERDQQIFLDLKLHDIPNTVEQAMKALAGLEVDLINVHAAGGGEMMEQALAGLEAGTASGRKRPACIAVTQLTSTAEKQMQKEQLITATLEESVLHYAVLAKDAGLDGVVCSVREAGTIRNKFGEDFLTVTPGIRLAEGVAHDQKRVATPAEARRAGVSAIVVGRAITASADPLASYYQVKQAWEGVLS
ncbi:orotidine-5'-phosphate decarboxylase [Bacillaceae bacterium Marseille-Q3522]|nr:orotidine-5'-phosphate decarboxylase [Bacillaceae bacterium Marseille-Q3522]